MFLIISFCLKMGDAYRVTLPGPGVAEYQSLQHPVFSAEIVGQALGP